MNKKNFVQICIMLAIFLLATGQAFAGNPVPGNAHVAHPGVIDKIPHPHVPKNFPKLLPDLIVSHVEAVPNGHGQCYLKITIKNQGMAGVPDTIYRSNKSAIQVFANNHPSSMVLAVFDPTKRLQRPMSTLTNHWFLNSPLLQGETDTLIKVFVDDDKAVKETNESNNRWQGSVQCLK